MEAIFLVCGAGGPQLKRNPLGSYNIFGQNLLILRFGFGILMFFIGCRTMIIGVRDGILGGHIRSRWHRDGRMLTGNVAIWYGAATTLAGAVVTAASLWVVVTTL